MEVKSFNPVLAALNISPSDEIVCVRECGTADSNFIITHLMKQFLQENSRICFVTIHQNLNHYDLVGRKLGYDIRKSIQENKMQSIDILSTILDDSVIEENFESELIKSLCKEIAEAVKNASENFNDPLNLIVDDLSHLLDLGVQPEGVINVINKLINMAGEKVRVIIGLHESNEQDRIIANSLRYVSDIDISVSPLTTGNSTSVTGVFSVSRSNQSGAGAGAGDKLYHYKTYDRGIKVLTPGECIYNLYK